MPLTTAASLIEKIGAAWLIVAMGWLLYEAFNVLH
jgi:hypothetical protein